MDELQLTVGELLDLLAADSDANVVDPKEKLVVAPPASVLDNLTFLKPFRSDSAPTPAFALYFDLETARREALLKEAKKEALELVAEQTKKEKKAQGKEAPAKRRTRPKAQEMDVGSSDEAEENDDTAEERSDKKSGNASQEYEQGPRFMAALAAIEEAEQREVENAKREKMGKRVRAQPNRLGTGY